MASFNILLVASMMAVSWAMLPGNNNGFPGNNNGFPGNNNGFPGNNNGYPPNGNCFNMLCGRSSSTNYQCCPGYQCERFALNGLNQCKPIGGAGK